MKRHFHKNKMVKRGQESQTLKNSIDSQIEFTWTPELFGPIFQTEKLTLWQALRKNLIEQQTKMMATFVPDELIYTLDLTNKYLNTFNGVLLLIDISNCHELWQQFRFMKIDGGHGINKLFNTQISQIIEGIYLSNGDIINFESNGIMALWRVRNIELIRQTIESVIQRALKFQNINKNKKRNFAIAIKLKITISIGEVGFSVIGNENGSRWVLFGQPVEDIRTLVKNCVAGDIILTKTAWQYLSPNNYKYNVIDENNIKIISEISCMSNMDRKSNSIARGKIVTPIISIDNEKEGMSLVGNSKASFTGDKDVENYAEQCVRASIIEAVTRKLMQQLKRYLSSVLIKHIEKDRLLEEICENRLVTIISINIVPIKCTNSELLNLCDECFSSLFRLVEKYSGIIETVIAHSKSIFLNVIFDSHTSDSSNIYTNGMLCAEKYLKLLNSIGRIKKTSIGASTGAVLCTIIGNFIRHAYVYLGLPIEKSEKIVAVSNHRVCCDFDSVLYSNLPQNNFRLRNIKGITGYGKFHIYEFHYTDKSENDHLENRKIHEIYPIVGRFDELEQFSNALDEICSSDRHYCGFIIEGPSRIGKSRLLDEFVLIAKSREISIQRLSLNSCDTSRSFNTIHQLLLNILNADSCYTIDKREKLCIKNFGFVSSARKFCYINNLMYVNFVYTQNYFIENDEQRDIQTQQLLDKFLQSIRQPTCIFLDDAHLIDDESWPFICNIMNHKNFFLTMSINSTKAIPKQNNFLCDSRLFKCTLGTLKSQEISLLACQFLNVHAISKKCDEILREPGNNHPGWCEMLISLMLERKWLSFQYVDRNGNIEDLISPPIVSIAKVPYGVFSDEINHDLPHYKLLTVDFNSQFELFINNHTSFSIVELYRHFFLFLSLYEQNLLNTAAILGDVFERDTLEIVMLDSTELETTRAITRLIELRIIECASIQRFNYNTSCYTDRSTFSDMHHLLHCACYQTNVGKEFAKENQSASLGYSYCKLLEFKSKDFRHFVYGQIIPSQRKNLHTIVAEIYERQAKRCSSCGGGSFLKTPITLQISGVGRGSSIMRQATASEFTRFKRKKRSVSVGGEEAHDVSCDQKISICDDSDDDQEITVIPENDKRKLKRIFDIYNDPSQQSQLKKFSMIDFRNCKCEKIINAIHIELLWHLEKQSNTSTFVQWTIETAAALLQIHRCLEALKHLAIAKKHNEHLSSDEQWINTIIILGLMGDASVALGKYNDAKNYFQRVLELQKDTKFTDEEHTFSSKFCWNRRSIFNNYTHNNSSVKKSRNEVSNLLSIAHYTMKLSKVYFAQGDIKHTKNTALFAYNIGFASVDEGFIEKCNFYIDASTIFCSIEQWKYTRRFERAMLMAMRKKHWWCNIDEILSVVGVLQLMFELRVLKGECENAYNIGIKILKISGTLHLTRITLTILPLMIQLAIRMKRVYQTADLMGQLYNISAEDIDESGITWYYSLSLDLALDAGMALEPFEKCVEHAKKILESKYRSCVSRDPECLKRLLTCLWVWQLRMGTAVTPIFPQSTTSYTNSIKFNSHSQILTLAKGLGCYLLQLRRYINIKNSSELPELLQSINLLFETLEMLAHNSWFIRPRLFMLKAYLKMIHGDKCGALRLLKRGRKYAISQGNQMMVAWILQSETSFKMQQYNNIIPYWAEHASTIDDFNWRNIHDFDVKAWSAVLYPIPVPESCL